MRTGVIAKKMGMTRLFQDDGRHVPVTVLALENLQVVARRDGRAATAITPSSSAPARPRRRIVAKPQRGHFGKAEVEPKAKVVEFRVDEDGLLDVGAEITADHFVAGQLVDVQGVTQGKGFAGAHEALGLRRPARHPRRLALAPLARLDRQRQDPGKVFKNKKMAGHMGARNRTQQNLEIVRTDAEPRPDLRQGLGARARRAAGCWSRTRSRSPVPTTPRIPAGLEEHGKAIEHEEAPAGMVEEAAEHEIPALPERRRGRRHRRRAGGRRRRRRRAGQPKSRRGRRQRARRRRKQGGLTMKVKVQNLDGGKAGSDIELNDAVFGVEPRADILHRVVTWQLEKRRGTARGDPRALRRRPHRQEVRPPEGRRHRPPRRPPRPDLHRRRQGPRRRASATSIRR